ncbi:WEB family protein [Striga hermonthica]|uniref:WEB family protein n=1 Tax=Striga hermonthica TaxID=68872 RepID=A0A9N7R8M6_STRHE|nr:WEB family protein [Striga hermonthica]
MEEDGFREMNKAEIDTRAPFRSVKEAVMLFGDRVLASEVYGSRLKQMHEGTAVIGKYTNVKVDELEEAKQSLRKAREESMEMATTLFFLQQELERTRIELQQLKTCELWDHNKDHHRHRIELDSDLLEEVKFVEEDTNAGLMITETDHRMIIDNCDRNYKSDSQRKKYVRFANPPCVAQIVLPNHAGDDESVFQRQSSIKKKKKKQVAEFIRVLNCFFMM